MGFFARIQRLRLSAPTIHVQRFFDTAEREYRQCVVPGAVKIFGSPLPRSVASELEKVYVHFAMRGVLASGEWARYRVLNANGKGASLGKAILRLLAEAHPEAASFASICTAMERGKTLFAEDAELTDKVCGVFWKKCTETAAKTLVETDCLDEDEIECAEVESILKGLCRIEACFRMEDDADCDSGAEGYYNAFARHLRVCLSARSPVKYGQSSPSEDSTEYVYCTVAVPGIENTYSYLAGDGEYVPGDKVTVPFGRENTLRVGRVIAVQHCTAVDAPYPPSRTKTILGKADE